MRKISDCIITPFLIIRYHLHDFFLWFVFVILASQLGIIINVIRRWGFDGNGFQEALVPDCASGNFYTFCIVMCASLIWPIFRSITNRKPPEYSLIKTILLSILFIIVLLCSIFYSFSNISPHRFHLQLVDDWKAIDIPQCLFFVFAIILSIYSFGLSYLPDHEDKYHLSDDYIRNENNEVSELKKGIQKNAEISSTEEDIKL